MNYLYILATLLLLTLGGQAQAQPEPLAFGQLDARLLSAAPFTGDSAAEAVILCDYGMASIVGEGARTQVKFDRVTRIKILKKAGFDWGKVEVLLRHEQADHAERLTNLQGFTYNLVGGQVQRQALPESSVFTDRVSALYSLHKFALPNVREGSVIEYRYTLLSDYVFSFRGWQFQHSIPVRWSEYRAAMPHQFVYKILLQSKYPLALEEKAGEHSLTPRFRWAMRDVPALRTEPYMTTAADYVDGLTFELANYDGQDVSRSWEQIDYFITHDPELGQQLDAAGFLKADLARLPAPAAGNELQRLAAVRALVGRAVRCTGELRLQASAPLRKIYLETHQGNVADVNFLLVAALRAAGFQASPVLLSTRSHGRIRASLPLLSQFNYVAAHVALPDGQELVLDATDPRLPYDMLPERCLNQQGRLIGDKAGTSRWIELRPRHRHTHLQRVELQLSADGTLRGQVHEEFAGYAGAEARRELREQGERSYSQQQARQHAGWLYEGLKVSNADSAALPLALSYRLTLPSTGKQALDLIYLSPLRDFGIPSNPFRAETRAFPVDFGMAREEMLVISLSLPPGYALAELPRSKAVDLPDNGGRFVCSTTQSGSTVQLSSRLTLRKPQYSPAEYGQLRELYRLLLEKQAEKLIVKKG
ncbi:hypothetical protein GCM10023185_15970 [Hymenobacter saemangeumensis]|uniref:DUF3857 domain-containing protein n=1 Tax=Hymenobacter saemangeumensis TaxID=1084522 RepID=A0ABP8I9X9_9BACT